MQRPHRLVGHGVGDAERPHDAQDWGSLGPSVNQGAGREGRWASAFGLTGPSKCRTSAGYGWHDRRWIPVTVELPPLPDGPRFMCDASVRLCLMLFSVYPKGDCRVAPSCVETDMGLR